MEACFAFGVMLCSTLSANSRTSTTESFFFPEQRVHSGTSSEHCEDPTEVQGHHNLTGKTAKKLARFPTPTLIVIMTAASGCGGQHWDSTDLESIAHLIPLWDGSPRQLGRGVGRAQ